MRIYEKPRMKIHLTGHLIFDKILYLYSRSHQNWIFYCFIFFLIKIHYLEKMHIALPLLEKIKHFKLNFTLLQDLCY